MVVSLERVRGEVAPGLFVCPVNYVADRPVIRRLGDRECYLAAEG